jgi:hypothetical protein
MGQWPLPTPFEIGRYRIPHRLVMAFGLESDDMIAARIANVLLAIVISAVSCPVQAQESPGGRYLSCLVVEEDAEGEWIASRDLTERNGAVSSSRDSYEWRSKERIQFGPGMTLKWDINYDWPAQATAQATAQKTVSEDQVAVSLHFWFDAQVAGRTLKKPERTWIHLYRSANSEAKFSSTDTSLINLMLWQQFNNGNLSSKAVIPLDHVLAFGTGFDALVWNIRTEPNEFGGTQAVAKGLIPIAAMRGKVSNIPKLRRLLDKKAANFRTECDVPSVITTP